MIEARIVIANESFARELGAKFGIQWYDVPSPAPLGQAMASSIGLASPLAAAHHPQGLNVSLPSSLAGAGSLALSILNAGYAGSRLSALQNEGRGEIISNPRIVTSNQKEALIKQGDQIGYLTIARARDKCSAGQFKDVVLQLKVTPTITNDGRIFLQHGPVEGRSVRFRQDRRRRRAPQISTREVTTAVLWKTDRPWWWVACTNSRTGTRYRRCRSSATSRSSTACSRQPHQSKAELLVFVTPR